MTFMKLTALYKFTFENCLQYFENSVLLFENFVIRHKPRNYQISWGWIYTASPNSLICSDSLKYFANSVLSLANRNCNFAEFSLISYNYLNYVSINTCTSHTTYQQTLKLKHSIIYSQSFIQIVCTPIKIRFITTNCSENFHRSGNLHYFSK